MLSNSATQKFVTLSVTKSESGAGVSTAQDMMYCYRIITSLGLKVELPMVLEMDNKGAVVYVRGRRWSLCYLMRKGNFVYVGWCKMVVVNIHCTVVTKMCETLHLYA
jgi:hypothetical protein